VSLSSGCRIGPYEVVGPLGAGGMGEVYRAHDSRLGRHVALKVLPAHLALDAQRRARFLREAHVLASLNHPNISTLHGIEDLDGQHVLVMELVEGETLGDRLARLGSRLPFREILPIARQLVDALDAAHDRGIVHRDLKPDNIVVRADGAVKVLDFGIAKVLDAAEGRADGYAPTITQMTAGQPGPIIGTPAYMSPEQVRGEPVEPASDVWGFGCVLYEMLTGRSPFSHSTLKETLAHILEEDPDFNLLPPNAPSLISRLVRRCLEKERKARLRNIADARAYLDDAITTPSGEHESRIRPRHAAWRIAAISALGGAVVTGVATWIVLRPAPGRVARMTIVPDAAAALSVTPDRSVALTHDGARLIYVGNDATQIFVRPLNALESTPLVTATAGLELRGLFFSVDDQWLGYVENSFTMKKVAITGGPPVTVVTLDTPSRGATCCAPDGRIVFATATSETGLLAVAPDGGTVSVLTRPNRDAGEADHSWPEMLPDGRGVLFTILPVSGGFDYDAAQVAILDLASGKTKTLVRGGRHARYVSSGHIVYAAGTGLRAVGFDLRRLETRGTPVTVVPRVVTDALGSANFSVSGDGTLAYIEPTAERLSLVWVNRQGQEAAVQDVGAAFFHPRVSPKNDALFAAASYRDVWVCDLARAPVQLTLTPFAEWLPLWTPDGARLIYGSWRGENGVSNIYIQAADGTGQAERLSDSRYMHLPSAVTADGSAVLFTVFGPAYGPDIHLVRLPRGGAPGLPKEEVVLDSPRSERGGVVSPDMKWLAYEADTAGAPGRMEVYVRPFPIVGEGGVWKVSTGGGTQPLWSRKGDELFYLAADGSMMASRVEASGNRWIPTAPVKLFSGSYLVRTSDLARQYDVTSDSRRFLMIKRQGPSAPRSVVIVQNWAEELKRLVK
jgi:eukaryotic-like serine/threonine-protein kinase